MVGAMPRLDAELCAGEHYRFHTTIMRAVHNLHRAAEDVPIQDVGFQSRR